MMGNLVFHQDQAISNIKILFLEDFFRQNYLLLIYAIEAIAAAVGLLLLKKYKSTVVKYFIYFLVYVVITSIIGGYPTHFEKFEFLSILRDKVKNTIFQQNYWWFTLFWSIGSVMFFSFYYQKILNNRHYIKIIKYVGYIFLFSSICYIAIHWSDFFISTIPFIKIFGANVMILCIVLYFIEILKSNKILNFYRSLNFYISISLLIWWLVITPLVFYDIYFSTADWSFVILKWQIYLFANIFMYSMFTFALIWCKPENN